MEERKFIVYKHTSPSGKVYIGMTCLTPLQRWKKDGSGYKRNTHFWGAIQKYGWGNFKHEILAENLTQANAEKLEIEQIEKNKSTDKNFGYNIVSGGCVNFPTEETKLKISKANKGRKWTEEQKQRIAGRDKGRFVCDEWRAKMSISQTGRKHPEEVKIKISEANKGRIFTEEHKKHISEACVGRKLSEETKEKIRQSLLKRKYKVSEEHKEKIKKINSKPIKCLDTNIIYKSAKEASDLLQIPRTSISANLNKRTKHARGFHFEFYKKEE